MGIFNGQSLRPHRWHSQTGTSVINLLITMALASILMGIGVMDLRAISVSSRDAASQVVDFMKATRLMSIETVGPWEVRPIDSRTLRAYPVETCGGPQATIAAHQPRNLRLISGFEIHPTSWVVCFSSRGLSDAVVDISIRPTHPPLTQEKKVQVLLSGLALTL